MQIKRDFHAALLTHAILILAALNSGGTAFAGGDSPPPATHTHYKFTTIDITGAAVPYAYAINDEGVVSGFYSDSSGDFHGFLWHDGTSVTIDAPGDWVDTYIGAINDLGVAIGNYDDGLTVSHAALFRVRDQTWIRLPDVPGTSVNYGNGINNLGLALGVAYEGPLTDSYNGVGWIWDGRDYSFFAVPAGVGTFTGTYPSAINDEGVVDGYYEDSEGNYHGFLKRGSTITSFDVPGADATFAYGINDLGDVVGPYNVGQVPNGYILHEGNFVTVNVPGAAATALDGINNLGQIVGTYNDTAGNQYAFEATPLDY
jgi:probable HAF family extracellular repeat protein